MAKTGNTEMMRDALRQISLALWSQIDPGCNDDCCKPKRELAKIADAALAAPARNCDRYATLGEARDYFFRNYFVEDETRSSATAFAEWLFDAAEGGDNA